MAVSANLPLNWNVEHDFFICHLDALGYTLPQIVAKIREVFPGFEKDLIKERALDRRLQILDMKGQDYFSKNVDEYKWFSKPKEGEEEQVDEKGKEEIVDEGGKEEAHVDEGGKEEGKG